MNIIFVRAGNKGAYGITMASDVKKAIEEIQYGNPFKVMSEAVIVCSDEPQARELMTKIRGRYVSKRIRGIWYRDSIDLSDALSSSIDKRLSKQISKGEAK